MTQLEALEEEILKLYGKWEDLSAQLGVPVLDGVMPAVKFAEAMVDMGLRTSKVSTWGFPEQKNIVGFPMFTKQELIF